MRVIISPEAEQDANDIYDWREDEPRADPLVFARELADACLALKTKALIRPVFTICEGVPVRRWLLKQSEHHIYYEVDAAQGIVRIIRIWGARRGSGPTLKV